MGRHLEIDDSEVHRLHGERMSNTEIAARLGVSRDSVDRAIKRLGERSAKRPVVRGSRPAVPLDAARAAPLADLLDAFGGRLAGVLFGAFPGTGRAATYVMTDAEIESACQMGAVEAAARFDAAKGVKLVTYASLWMRAVVQKEMATRKEAGWPESEAGPLDVAVTGPGADAGAETAETAARVADVLRRMPKRVAHVLREHLAARRPLRDVAAELGVSRERARQLAEVGRQTFYSLWRIDA
jgi:RNA polymerase sigma factor (sigma-70 family)